MATALIMKERRRPTRPRRHVFIGPADHGRRMGLADFSRAEAVLGYHYELAHGVIQVTDIAGILHNITVDRVHASVHAYQQAHPGIVVYVAASFAAKIELSGRNSERHPDLSLYLTAPPEGVDQPWTRWTPEIVVEVLSASSLRRDLKEKPDDYLAAGIREYWIIDPLKRYALFLVRQGDQWAQERVGARGKWRTPLLPGYVLDLAQVFARIPTRR